MPALCGARQIHQIVLLAHVPEIPMGSGGRVGSHSEAFDSPSDALALANRRLVGIKSNGQWFQFLPPEQRGTSSMSRYVITVPQGALAKCRPTMLRCARCDGEFPVTSEDDKFMYVSCWLEREKF